MGDTVRGDFSDKICSDCGEKGCVFKHRSDDGALMKKGAFANFCVFCWVERNEAYSRGEEPKPLGIKPPGIPAEISGKSLIVTTADGSVYVLRLTENHQEVIVCCEANNLRFIRVKVLRLTLGGDLWLRMLDEEGSFWRASRVISIISDVVAKEEKVENSVCV